MAKWLKYYLTTGKNPKGDGLIAVISLGQPQRGDDDVVVCSATVVPNIEEARKWYREQMKTKPWLDEAAGRTVN